MQFVNRNIKIRVCVYVCKKYYNNSSVKFSVLFCRIRLTMKNVHTRIMHILTAQFPLLIRLALDTIVRICDKRDK